MLQLKIDCNRQDVEAISLLLEESGALSLTLSDQFDDPILEPELGTTPLWPNVVIHTLYESAKEVEHALQRLTIQYPNLNITTQTLPEQDWERVCMDDFKPMQFGARLWICPSWQTPPDPKGVNLLLDPGLAFGTGTHPTTSLCLTWLEKTPLHGKALIDYGCGSGVLSIAAVKLGAQHAAAVDIDSQALLSTRDNAARNHIEAKQLVTSLPEQLTTSADVIVANILLSPLLELKERFHQLLKTDGALVVSGILREQVSNFAEFYDDLFKVEETIHQDDWALVRCSRRSVEQP